jgi:hypothetical protein
MTRWQRQFDDINSALLGIRLTETMRDVIARHVGDEADGEASPGTN